ncbi:hypothetical protein BGW80DRAFT_1257896 [Lactifluus volemus]|nr:hypothetical protein BGW80DRAFT_1257896 [Lactifluus volemus]
MLAVIYKKKAGWGGDHVDMLDVVSPVLAIWAPLTHLRFDPHSTWVRYLVMFGRRLGLLEWVSEKRKLNHVVSLVLGCFHRPNGVTLRRRAVYPIRRNSSEEAVLKIESRTFLNTVKCWVTDTLIRDRGKYTWEDAISGRVIDKFVQLAN